MAGTYAMDQFSLRWNNFSNNLTSGFMSHLSDKDLVDVTLAVDGQLLQAHKLVLSICSPYFKDIFKNNPCQHPVVILQDIGCTEVEALLRFMYQGEVNVRQEELANFLKVAEILQIKGLTGDEAKAKDHIKVEDDETFSSEILNSNCDYDSKDWQNVDKHTMNFDELTPKRKSRESARKQGTTGFSKKKSRLTLPALKNIDIPLPSLDSIENAANVYVEEDEDDVKFFQRQTSPEDLANYDQSVEEFKGDTANITKDDLNDDKGEEFISENTRAKNTPEDTFGTVTYRLSARGRPQLVHEGYVYNLTSRSEVLNRSHYRCAEQHRGCRGKCAVIAERFMPTGVHEHNHLPGYQSENDYKKKKVAESEQN